MVYLFSVPLQTLLNFSKTNIISPYRKTLSKRTENALERYPFTKWLPTL